MRADAPRLMVSELPGHGPVRIRRPLPVICLIFLAGVMAGAAHSCAFTGVAALSALLLLAAVLVRHEAWAHCFLYLAIGVIGVLFGGVGRMDPAPCSLMQQVRGPRCYLGVDGVVADDPVYAAAEDGSAGLDCELRFQLVGLRQRMPWLRSRGEVRVFVRGAVPGAFEFGQRWTMSGLLIRSTFAQRPDVFTLYTDMDHCRRLSGSVRWNLSALCFRARRRCADILSRGIGETSDTAVLLRALLLGYRSDLPGELRELFASTGTFHIFAISGLHVGIVAVLLIGLLKIAGLSREHWFFGLLPLLVLYTVGTGGRASAVRACVMALIFWGAPLAGRRPDSLSALALAALCIVLADSMQLMQPGFVMSFVVVAGLILMYPSISSVWHRGVEADPWRLERERGGPALLRSGVRRTGDLFCVSLAAWLASAPVTAYYFNLISPISLLGNIVVVPGTFLVVFTGCLSLLTGLIIPPAAAYFNFANRAFLDALLWVVRGMQAVPGGHCFVQSPSGWMMAGWYAGLAVLFFGTPFLRRLLGVVVLGCLSLGVWFAYHQEGMTVDVLDTGHGYASLVNLPGESDDMLVDAGCTRSASRITAHLRRCGVDRLGVLVLSYPGYDALAGAGQVLTTLPVRELWCVNPAEFSAWFRGDRDAKLYEDLIRQARKNGVSVRFLSAGDGGFLRGMQWDVFHPVGDGPLRSARDAALVLRVARDGCGVLFMGGARQQAERVLARSPESPSASVLVAGGHGGAGTCALRFLRRVHPAWTVLSVGLYNVYGEPDPGVPERLKACGIRALRTDQSGTVRIRWTDARRGHYRIEAGDDGDW